MATIFVWLRYSSSRQLTWQRNYNTQPRILGEAQARLTHAIAQVLQSEVPTVVNSDLAAECSPVHAPTRFACRVYMRTAGALCRPPRAAQATMIGQSNPFQQTEGHAAQALPLIAAAPRHCRRTRTRRAWRRSGCA